jgi:phosphoribosyl 1,2-cyclic phosphodiesterase/DNA-binding response OmpR family regulator
VRIQFWGTRGSIATPGSRTARYGGNTSCVEVRSARGTLVVLDCGTGARPLGRKLMSGGANGLRGNLFISHTHWDHIQGIPFFAPLFARGTEWDVYGPKGLGASLREALAVQMQYDYFPVTLDECSARIRFHDLVEGSFEVDDIKVSTRYLNHPALTLAYRLEADGAVVVYACDHEPHARMLAVEGGHLAEQDRHHAEFAEGADLLIHDAQYTAAEYPGKIGWGHSPAEYVVSVGRYARVKRVALTHHDPLRDDDAIDRMIATLRQHPSAPDVFAACEGQVVQLGASRGQGPVVRADEHKRDAELPVGPDPGERSVLLDVADPGTAAVLGEALCAEGIFAKTFSSLHTARALMAQERPWLAILEHDPPRVDGLDMCRSIRSLAKDDDRALPILMVAEQKDHRAGEAAGVTDWLVKPFTVAHARSKIGAWLLRTASQSIGNDASAAAKEPAPAATETLQAEQVMADETTVLRATSEEGTGHLPERGSQLDKSALLWMYGREIAPFETAAFSSMVGDIIARAKTAPHRRMRPSIAARRQGA